MLLRVTDVKILRNGAGGGHIYLQGICELPSHGRSRIFAYFGNKGEEKLFENKFCGESVILEANRVDYIAGVGGEIRDVVSWSLA